MAEQQIEIENTETSPCLRCPWKLEDKNNCISICKPLQAFQSNKPYANIPYPTKVAQIASKEAETAKSIEPAKTNTIKVDRLLFDAVQAMKREKEPEEIIVHETSAPSKAALIKSDKCLICGRDGKKYKLRQGLCVSKCYGSWRDGRKEHPLLGEWQKMSKAVVMEARFGKYTDCLMPDCTDVGDRRGLCRKCYRSWIGGTLLHPKFGKFFKKHSKKATETIRKMALEDISNESILIDFKNYPKLINKLKEMEKESYLPIEAIIVSLLAETLGKKCDKELK